MISLKILIKIYSFGLLICPIRCSFPLIHSHKGWSGSSWGFAQVYIVSLQRVDFVYFTGQFLCSDSPFVCFFHTVFHL